MQKMPGKEAGRGIKREREDTDSEDVKTNCEKQGNYSVQDIQPISFMVDWAGQWPKQPDAAGTTRTHYLKVQDDDEWQYLARNKRNICEEPKTLPEKRNKMSDI